MSYDLGRAIGAENALSSWKIYAKQLEDALAVTKAAAEGVKAVRDQAVKELAKIDPKHFFLNKENRNEVYEMAYEEALKKLEELTQPKKGMKP